MYVVVQIRRSLLEDSSHSPSGLLPADLQQEISRLGVNLVPMHPGTTDPTLASYFYVETPDQPTAERVIAQLQKHNAVEAAFLKPPEGPP
jgi:hypothetical protein